MGDYSPFEQRIRNAARLALYVAVTLVAVAFAAGVVWSDRWLRPRLTAAAADVAEWQRYEEVTLLQEYLRVDTSATTGSELAGARYLADRLASFGLEPQIEAIAGDRANVWAILEGEEPGAVVLHSHIDVAPIGDAAAWQHPPFSGTIDPPFVYGRGAFDMKSTAIAQLLAARDAVQPPRRPRRSLIVLATGSEETGGDFGTRWVLANHPELTRRFDIVLTEGGIVEMVSTERIKYLGIESAQRRIVTVSVCAAEREPLEALRSDVLVYDAQRFAPWLSPEAAATLGPYSRSRMRRWIQHRIGPGWVPGNDVERYRKLPFYIRSMVEDGLRISAVEPYPGGGWQLEILFLLLPGRDWQEARQELLPDWLVHDMDTAVRGPIGSATGSPTDHWALGPLLQALAEHYPGAPSGPYLVPFSVTDARFFREAHIPAYGFSPFLFFSTESFRADDRNERINLPGYVEGVAVYRDAVRRLLE